MKKNPLNETEFSIMLNGEIEEGYRVLPGVKITFGEGSIFEGVAISSGTTFRNNEHVIKQFSLDASGQLQLASITYEDGGLQWLSPLIISSSDNAQEFDSELLALPMAKPLQRSQPITPSPHSAIDLPTSPYSPQSVDGSEPSSPMSQTPNRDLSLPYDQAAQENHNDQPPLSGDDIQETSSSCCICIML
jgi:hypothetical protein